MHLFCFNDEKSTVVRQAGAEAPVGTAVGFGVRRGGVRQRAASAGKLRHTDSLDGPGAGDAQLLLVRGIGQAAARGVG